MDPAAAAVGDGDQVTPLSQQLTGSPAPATCPRLELPALLRRPTLAALTQSPSESSSVRLPRD